jgi:hypothetical protein
MYVMRTYDSSLVGCADCTYSQSARSPMSLMLRLHVASSPAGQLVLALTRICHKASPANFSSKAFHVHQCRVP